MTDWSKIPDVKIEWKPSVIVAGTFNRFHGGHRRLLVRAIWESYQTGMPLIIGVTHDAFARRGRKVEVRPWFERAKSVSDFVEAYVKDCQHADAFRGFVPTRRIMFVFDKNQMPSRQVCATMVVSEETEPHTRALLKALRYDDTKVVVVPMKKDEKGNVIHSTDLILKEKEERK